MMVEPPTRLSTMTCWPSRSPILTATMRAMVSELEPAENGTIILIGRSGHSARAGLTPMLAAAKATRTSAVRIITPPPSGNLLGFAQAVEQRGSQQELAGKSRVVGLAPQLMVVALAHRGVALLQQSLVADGLRLGVFHRHVPPLPFVSVEFFIIGFVMQDA